MEEIRDVLHFIFRIDTQEFKSFASLDEVCFSTFSYTVCRGISRRTEN